MQQSQAIISKAAIAAVLVLVASYFGCACTRNIPRPYPEPSAAQLLTVLEQMQERARSFQAESVMDYWVGDQRVKGTVLLMGERGARMRINALNPAGDSVAADLACDGASFEYIDYNNNCQLTGPCTRDSVAQLLRISLHPDDFLLMVMGATPVIPGAQGRVEWAPSKGVEILHLESPGSDLRQTIALDGRNGVWAVVSSQIWRDQGPVLWSLENKDLHTIEGAGGAEFRVPEKTKLVQPQERADLLIRWGDRQFNIDIGDSKFDMEVPAGLPRCSAAGPQSQAG